MTEVICDSGGHPMSVFLAICCQNEEDVVRMMSTNAILCLSIHCALGVTSYLWPFSCSSIFRFLLYLGFIV
jgi:hypothetical protein